MDAGVRPRSLFALCRSIQVLQSGSMAAPSGTGRGSVSFGLWLPGRAAAAAGCSGAAFLVSPACS